MNIYLKNDRVCELPAKKNNILLAAVSLLKVTRYQSVATVASVDRGINLMTEKSGCSERLTEWFSWNCPLKPVV